MLFCGFCAAVGFANPALATTYWVDRNAGTGGDGSEAQPWKYLSQVNAKAFAPGDVVNFKRGGSQVWREQLTVSSSGTSAAPITFRAWGEGFAPTIKGANRLTGWTLAPTAWVYKAALATRPYVVTGNDQWLKKGASATSLNNNEWYWDGSFLYFKDASGNPDTTGKNVEAGVRNHCILIKDKNHVVIDGFTLEKSNDCAILLQRKDNWSSLSNAYNTVKNCTVRLSHTLASLNPGGGGAIHVHFGTNTAIVGNTLSAIRGDGIAAYRSPNITIENNTVGTVYVSEGHPNGDCIALGGYAAGQTTGIASWGTGARSRARTRKRAASSSSSATTV